MRLLNSFSSVSKGVFLSIVLFSSLFLIISFDDVEAADKVVTASSVGFEKTTIIEFENSGTEDIETVRLWLGSDITFKSFKTEKGWTGTKSPQGVLIFTTTEPLKPGETVKFGVKTDKEKPGINWKALDEKDEQLETGKTLVSDLPSNIIKEQPSETTETKTDTSTSGILSDSSFRLIPEKPNVGSTIRVTGESFGSNQELDFYMDDKKLDSFKTDDSGFFIFTSKIPEDEKADRVDFVVKDKQGNEKTFSLRLGDAPEVKIAGEEDIPLSIENLPGTAYRGDVILVKGTGNPGSSITATITNPDGDVITTESAEIGLDGKWTYETIVPIDAILGKYSATITDGKHNELRTWTIESSQKIQIVPSQLKFDPGELMTFNGTAVPSKDVEVVLENPQGSEVFSDILEVDSSGFVEFEFSTTQSDIEGTYVLFAFQEEHTAITLVGLGELPEAQLILKTDKLNYDASDVAQVAIDGPPSATVSLIVVDPSDKTKFSDSIVLGPDGKKDYDLELTGYKSGVYTLVMTRGNAQAEDVFSVGLQTGSGPISIQTTKTEYMPGDPILVLGDSGTNILVTLTLIDPDGNEVKIKESFTNKEGKISVDSFRVPSDAVAGVWSINGKSGPNFDTVEFDVNTGIEEGMLIVVDNLEYLPTLGDIVNFRILGAQSTITVDIYSSSDELVGEVSPPGYSDDYATLWSIPNDLEPGTYTIVASDGVHSANGTFVYAP